MPTDGARRALVIKAAVAAAAVAVLCWIPQQYGLTQTNLYAEALVLSVAAMGLNLLTGYNGQVSIGHGAFFGIGAYTSGILMLDHGWPFLATLPVAAVLAAAVGAAVGFPALRVKGLYLALITLGLATLFPALVSKFVKSTGGTSLVQLYKVRPKPPTWASSFAGAEDQWRYYITLVVAGALFVLMLNLVRGRFGRAIVAVREHEAAAETLGINLARVKISAFAISAMYAGVAGSLAALVRLQANAGQIEVFQQSIIFLVAVVIGGTATTLGPVVGGFVVVLLQDRTTELIKDKPTLSPALFGIALILLMYVLPDGLVGGFGRMVTRIRRRMFAGSASDSDTT